MNRADEKLEWFEHVVQAFAGMTSGGWLRQPCPRCEEESGEPDYKHSLGYNTRTGGFNCFKCGMKGSLPTSWRSRLEMTEPGEYDRPQPEKPRELEPAEGYVPIFEGDGAEAMVFDPARSYVLRSRADGGRGLPWAVAEGMRIGASLHGRLAGRIIVPIFDYSDPAMSWRGWVARDYTGRSQLPYRYPKGMVREGLLYNAPALLAETNEPVFICEGVFDASVYWPDGVACMGKPLRSHLDLFLAARRPIVVALDGDAWEEGWMLSLTLKHLGKRAVNLRLPPKTDADEVDETWLKNEVARLMAE